MTLHNIRQAITESREGAQKGEMKCSVTLYYYGENELTLGNMKTVFTADMNRRVSSCLESTASGSHATALQFPFLALHFSETADTSAAF